MQDLADRLPPKLGTAVRWMVAIKINLCAAATLSLPITFFLVVIFRYILHADLFAYEEWLLPISFWLYFLASGVGSYQGSHIRADIFESYFTTAVAIWWRRVLLGVVETALTFVMVYWGWLMIASDLASYPFWQKTTALKIPFLVPHLGIFIGLVFMAFYTLLHLYVLLRFGPPLIEEELDLKPVRQETF